jgi:hypothetical protein
MAMPSTKFILLNAAASIVAIGAVVGVVRSWVAPASLRPCNERYEVSMTFPLEREGAILSAMDIQARTGGSDAGLLENLQVTRLKKGPVPVAMSVELPKGSGSPTTSVAPRGGISFPWQPRSLKDKSAVCLSYQMLLPSDFDFNLGGALPGLIGQADQSADRFLVRLSWQQGGAVGVTNFMTLNGRKFKQQTDAEGSGIPRGRWFQVDQEVVLNAPDRENGTLRIWIDGALVVDKADFAYRARPDVAFAGVAADFYYTGEDAVTARSPADATVWLSPFEVRWQ